MSGSKNPIVLAALGCVGEQVHRNAASLLRSGVSTFSVQFVVRSGSSEGC